MPDVQQVIVQVRGPGADEGQVTTGYYTVANNLLTMTDGGGSPVLDPVTGAAFEHRLAPGDNPRSVAAVLTKDVRRALRGETKAQERFGRQIVYPRTGAV